MSDYTSITKLNDDLTELSDKAVDEQVDRIYGIIEKKLREQADEGKNSYTFAITYTPNYTELKNPKCLKALIKKFKSEKIKVSYSDTHEYIPRISCYKNVGIKLRFTWGKTDCVIC